MSQIASLTQARQALAQGLHQQAISAYQYFHDETPSAEEPLAALCHLYTLEGNSEQALPFAHTLMKDTYSPQAKRHAGMVFLHQKHLEAAHECFLAANPFERKDVAVIAYLNDTAIRLLDWPTAHKCQQVLIRVYRQTGFSSTREKPFRFGSWCAEDSCSTQVAKRYWQRNTPADIQPLPTRRIDCSRDSRIKLGYLSSDWYQHATLELMIGLFEHHDQALFDIHVYCHSPKDISSLRKRLEDAPVHLVELHNLTDQQAAQRIYQDEIDILVDCKGYTRNSRFPVFAYRPAPIQVNWLAYPGSMGSPVHDYLIGDPWVTPRGCENAFSEAICRLPHTYQPNDNRRPIASDPISRASEGLPENAVVFCCFNQAYKLDEVRWRTFMQILRDVPSSVLWLLEPASIAKKRLLEYAHQLRITPSRLLFAAKKPSAQHLARLQLADIALDTRVYNGHTTTADALWAGVPVLTTRGTHFASRVSESLLNAVGLPELVNQSEQAFHTQAVRLAQAPAERETLRNQLKLAHTTSVLFDTARFTRHIEAAFRHMAIQNSKGLKPGNFEIRLK